MTVEEKLSTICDMQMTIMHCMKKHMDDDILAMDTHEAYEIIDMIKDLSETEKYIREAEYYKTVTSAMVKDHSGEDIIKTIKDVWKHAAPDKQLKMKTDISNLLMEM